MNDEELKKKALEVADESFWNMRDNSTRNIMGGGTDVDFEFKNKKYNIWWNGFWEKTQDYEYHITGNGVSIKGFREL